MLCRLTEQIKGIFCEIFYSLKQFKSTIPPACQPLLTLNTGFWARFLRLHHWQLVFTPIAFTAWGRRREEMEWRRINGHGKDRRADRKTGRRKERWWVHRCLARLWLGTYLWRTWCGCREEGREVLVTIILEIKGLSAYSACSPSLQFGRRE